MSNPSLAILALVLIAVLAPVITYYVGRYSGRKLVKGAIDAERADAKKRQRAVLGGQFSEQLAPYLPGFNWNPNEVRFIGKPIDFLVFSGLDDKTVNEVIFVEVKSGSSQLSPIERKLRDAIKAGKVRWVEYRVPRQITG